MRHFVYSIYDSASGIYMRPFVAATDQMASRSFTDIANDANHEIGRHPEDYTLFRLGLFDDNTGTIEPEAPTKVINALEAIAASQKVDGAQLQAFDAQVAN